MKKGHFLFFAIFSLLIAKVFAQSYDILDENDNVISGQTFDVIGTLDETTITFPFKIRNNTGNTISTRIEKKYINISDGSYSTFCIPSGACMPPSTFISTMFELSSEETSSLCGVYFYPENIQGTSIIKHTVFNENDTSDNVSFTINFIISHTDNNIENQQKNSLSFSPNPASNYFYLKHNINMNSIVEIYNTSGKIVAREKIKNNLNKTFIDCSGWSNGIYFARITNEDKYLRTIKIIISK